MQSATTCHLLWTCHPPRQGIGKLFKFKAFLDGGCKRYHEIDGKRPQYPWRLHKTCPGPGQEPQERRRRADSWDIPRWEAWVQLVKSGLLWFTLEGNQPGSKKTCHFYCSIVFRGELLVDLEILVSSDKKINVEIHNERSVLSWLAALRKLSGLAFKVAADPYIGTLTFYRIYSGKVKAGDMVWNPRRSCQGMWEVV